MKSYLIIFASILAFVIAAMGVFAGGRLFIQQN